MDLSAHDQPRTSPPKARLTFRVGVVGHRPNRLQQADLAVLSEVLQHVLVEVKAAVAAFAKSQQGMFGDGVPVLRAISPLAEGTDRMFARSAIGLGYELCCPMPFAQEEFENDFKEAGSLAAFRAILDEAQERSSLVKFELDGSRAREGAAYGAAGRVVLNQSDLLVVVWDGLPAAGGGGTVQTLQEAIAYRVPVLWIDAHAPHSAQLLRDASGLACLDCDQRCVPASEGKVDLQALVTQILGVPGAKNPPLLGTFLWRTVSKRSKRKSPTFGHPNDRTQAAR